MRHVAQCLVAAVACVAMACSSPSPSAIPSVTPFVTASDIDLQKFLPPPPPAVDSVETQRELDEILAVQSTRTPEAIARAQADVVEDVWRFADVVGPRFTKGDLPKLSAFFDRVVATEGAVVDPAKNAWKRVRPYVASTLVKPVVTPSSSGSYPSGHTTVGTMMGIVLSNMLPERRREIMTRAWEYGWNRLVGGVHYRSDIEAGRIAGSLIVQGMMAREDFRAEFTAASAELRSRLGLTH